MQCEKTLTSFSSLTGYGLLLYRLNMLTAKKCLPKNIQENFNAFFVILCLPLLARALSLLEICLHTQFSAEVRLKVARHL